MIRVLGVALVILSSSPVVAHAKAAKAASIRAAYAGSNIEKRLLLSECREANLEEVAAICSKKLVDLSSADIDRIKEALASRPDSVAEPAAEEEFVSSKAANINVASGDGVQQSTSTNVTAGAMDCIRAATQNTNRAIASLNARMAGRFANKK